MQYASDISLFWLLPWGLISIVIGFWYYSRNEGWLKDVSQPVFWLLRVLRSLTIFLLGVLLIGIIFQSFKYRSEDPKLVVAIDNSSSMLNYSDSSKILNGTEELISKLQDELGGRFNIEILETGEKQVKSVDKVNFNSPISNLSNTFEYIRATYYNQNLGGVVFISDGNFNAGQLPSYAARKNKYVPVFSIAVGDTIPKRDHLVKNVTVNATAFLKNEFPVIVDIEGNNMGKGVYSVSIFKNGKSIANQKVNYNDGNLDFEQSEFVLTASSPGIHRYTVKIEDAKNEYNYQNNERSFYIEVIDSRSVVHILGGGAHPDITAIKSVLDKDENLEVKTELFNDWDGSLEKCDLVILHQLNTQLNSEKLKKIAASKISKLIISGTDSDRNKMEALGIPFSFPSSSQMDDVQGSLNPSFQSFECSEVLKKAFEFYPPLKARFGKYSYPNGIETLVQQRIGNVIKNEPLIFFGKTNGSKYGVIAGEGVWKWKMIEFARKNNSEAFNELFSKITQYLTVKSSDSPLKIDLPKRFSQVEEIIVNATFLNESLEPITTPEIEFELVDEQSKKRKMQFATTGRGYKLNLQKLNPGQYQWKASAAFKGKKYMKEGFFIVSDLDLESQDTRANHALMNQLAQETGGEFLTFDDRNSVVEMINSRKDLTSVSYQESSFNNLIDYFILLVIALFCLALEWFLRRYYGSY